MNYCILGAGAWGTALAIHIARCGQPVTLVPRRMEHALALAADRENVDYLPGHPLDVNIQIACELGPALMEAEVVFLACPMKGLRDLCEQLKTHRASSWGLQWIVTLCKGLEPETHLRPGQIVSEVFPDLKHAAFSGPSFADEVAQGQPTAITFASESNDPSREKLQHELSNKTLRVYLSHDLVGVELGGCLKNIYAIGAGIADGLGLGDNPKAAYMTRALRETIDLTTALGAEPTTCFGLSGFGDLVATCNGKGSRNRSFGQALARGEGIDALLQNRRTVVEGYWATKSFYELAQRKQLAAPILIELYAVLYENKEPREAIGSLMMRQLKDESV